MTKPVSVVAVSLSPAAFAAVYQLLAHVRLGNRNEWESAIADTLISWEDQGLDRLVEQLEDEVGLPVIAIEASDEDGLVFNLK